MQFNAEGFAEATNLILDANNFNPHPFKIPLGSLFRMVLGLDAQKQIELWEKVDQPVGGVD
jgi:hypothetical protein